MVRRDLLKDTFGARQASVGDLFTGNTRWNPKVAREFEKVITGMFGVFGKDAFTTLVGSEQNIQDVIAGVKQTIVVRSVVVPVANMVSNMVMLMNRGVPIRAIIHGVGAKTAEINSYVKRRQREIDLEADLRAANGKNDTGAALKIENQIQSIKDSYRRMSIWPLIEAGEFSAISSGQVTAEDLALSDGRWSNFLEKKINSLDGPLREIARYGLVTRDTALSGRQLQLWQPTWRDSPPLTDPTPYIFGVKVSTLVASAVMGIIAVLLDIKRHSVLTGILAVAAGMGVAVLATDPIVSGLHLEGTWSHAVAGVLGISGRNLIVWVSLVSKDPLALWDRIKGAPPKK